MTSLYFDTAISVVERPLPPEMEASGSFWRKEPPELNDARQLVRGGLWPSQLAWWNLPNFIKLLVGGYGCGKTVSGCKRLISLALQNAPCPVAAVSPTFAMARTTVIATIKVLLVGKQSLVGKKLWWKYNASNHEFFIKYRGRSAHIICYSGENPDALKGPNLAATLIDEPFIQAYAVFEQMIARIRHPQAVHSELILTGTPEQLNWGYDLCRGEMEDQQDVASITMSTRENLVLSDAYIKRLEGALSDKAIQAYIDGKFTNLTEGMVYYGFDGSPNSPNIRDFGCPDDGVELGAGMDFNVNPMSACVFWRSGSHMHFFDEIELPNADTEFMCQVLRERYGERLNTIYPDATGSRRNSAAPGGRSDFTYIEQAGFEIDAPGESPKRKDRYNAVNGKLAPKSGHPTVTIDVKCKKLIKYLSIYSHELMNKQKDMSHLLDAFAYPICYLFPADGDTLRQYKLKGA